jgi:hypothetical protein
MSPDPADQMIDDHEAEDQFRVRDEEAQRAALADEEWQTAYLWWTTLPPIERLMILTSLLDASTWARIVKQAHQEAQR